LWLPVLDDRNHIVRRQRPPDPLQLELADWLDLDGLLDCHQHTRADKDLSWLGFVAQSRGDVRNGPNGSVVEPALEADGAEGGEAVRDADAEFRELMRICPGLASSQSREATLDTVPIAA
jgi:hypothetical protein